MRDPVTIEFQDLKALACYARTLLALRLTVDPRCCLEPDIDTLKSDIKQVYKTIDNHNPRIQAGEGFIPQYFGEENPEEQ